MAGDVLLASQLNTDVRDNLGVLSTALLLSTHVTGQRYSSQGGYSTGVADTQAVSANTLYGAPFTVPSVLVYDQISVYCSAVVGTDNARLGVYVDNGGVPGALSFDAGAVTLTAGAEKVRAIAQQLAGPAKYWLACLFDAASTLQIIHGTGLMAANSAPTTPSAGVYKSSVTYGALPDPFGAITSFASVVPLIWLKRS